MAEITDNSISKASINLSRNSPVALVVGAASFLGSHLVDKLLDKSIQVIGVDDLASGEKRNLEKAAENRNFHLIIESPDKLDIDLSRLDYIFILPGGEWNLGKVLDLFKKNNCRCLFVSSIDLYEKDNDSDELGRLKSIESRIAKFAADFNLNARILRLGSVYGPRMQFKIKEPLAKLIQQALTGDLHKDVSLEFSSRALYVSDAVDLMVRTILAGSTAQKIFDGVLPTPVKVAEIKMVLMDPLWYESRDFTPSELPPWSTPNLEKTIKFLNWQPKISLVTALRETIQFFKDNEISVPKLEEKVVKEIKVDLDEDKKEDLEFLKLGGKEIAQKVKKKAESKFSLPMSKIYLILVIFLVGYALIWPGLVFGWGLFTFSSGISQGLRNLERGEFEESLANIKQANIGVQAAKSVFNTLEPIRKLEVFDQQFILADNLSNLSILSVTSAENAVLGMQALLQSLKAVTGETAESPNAYFALAQVELSSASDDLSKITALLKSPEFGESIPPVVKQQIESFSKKLEFYQSLVTRAKTMSMLLPQLVGMEGNKSYLIILQNNMELRPGGGFIGSFAKINFEVGKLKKLEVNDIYNLDGSLSMHVEPPKEIKEDLGQKDWFLRDSNWEPDFPTNARQAEWFYNKEAGERVEGVIALDISAMEELLSVIGPLDLADYSEQITSENLFAKAITYAESGFFPGSQAKKSFLTALTNQAFNKIFFLPQKNWPGIISAIGRSLDEKHISIYLNDPKLFSYLDSQNWVNILPRGATAKTSQDKTGQDRDFLALVEANLGANKVNYYLDRSYKLETVVGKEGEIRHTMRINYTNRSPSDTFPGGKYKNRMRVYLPFGSKLTKALWGETDITKQVSSFTDYGRSGFSMLLELLPKEQKSLVLDYSVPFKIEFKDNLATYRLDIIKQAGTLNDPLQWTISYPINYQLASGKTTALGPQEQTISTDLSRDRSFEVGFKK
ncbi:DUF4012 domain-containing protein [Candidatus Daviesbacteria bacterium]|nr:DUF4012 domain-containing protein [Candidatus Daviesbacteria bacterium]